MKEFLASFEVDPSDDIKCAAVGRLWESLLEKYPGVPFLMLRVADMRWKLNSRVTAYAMYLDVRNARSQTDVVHPSFFVAIAPTRLEGLRLLDLAPEGPRQGPHRSGQHPWVARPLGLYLVQRLTAIALIVRTYKDNTSIYTPSQRWRPNVAQDRIPASSCKLQHAEYVAFQDSWDQLNAAGVTLATYLNYHCLETNAIEGVLQFDPAVRTVCGFLPVER